MTSSPAAGPCSTETNSNTLSLIMDSAYDAGGVLRTSTPIHPDHSPSTHQSTQKSSPIHPESAHLDTPINSTAISCCSSWTRRTTQGRAHYAMLFPTVINAQPALCTIISSTLAIFQPLSIARGGDVQYKHSSGGE